MTKLITLLATVESVTGYGDKSNITRFLTACNQPVKLKANPFNHFFATTCD